ncbi:MAG: ABC transporter substrate-binding protein [Rhodobacteraceae bacterium]|nr:ABC transporter substrate-binding protein [Paracoccaceae bacterium]
MPLTNPNRRMVMAGAAAALLPLPALGQSEATASSYVQRVIDDVLEIINSNQSEAQILRRFKQVFTSYADINNIAQRVLGPPYRSLGARQKQAFSDAYGNYLSSKYGRQFRGYRGASIEIIRTNNLGGRKGVLVYSQVRQPGQSPFALDWQVSDGSGQTKLVDLIIEGIQLVSTERSEMRALLEAQRGDVGALTAFLARA